MPPKSRNAPKVTITREGAATLTAHLLMAGSYASARPLDFATVEVESLTSTGGSRFEDVGFRDGLFSNDIAKISIGLRSGATQQVHYGRISSVEARMTRAGETFLLHSRLDDHLFGSIVHTQYTVRRSPIASDSHTPLGDAAFRPWEFVGAETVFNPVYQGMATPNQAAGLLDGEPFFRLVDPRSVAPQLLNAARRGDRDVVNWWTLPTAVDHLCKTLNSDQAHVLNPGIGALIDTLGASDEKVRNVKIPNGIYLPQALDLVLKPHGFSWKVELESETTRRIVVFRLGGGTPRSLKLQKYGETLDTNKTNVKQFRINFDAANTTFNAVVVTGAVPRVEASFILRPAWNSKFDDPNGLLQDFLQDSDKYKDDPERQQAWRRFVANESGAHTGTRPWWPENTSLGELGPFLAFAQFRRRRLMPAISQDSRGESLGRHQGIFAEFYDYREDPPVWTPIDQLEYGSFQLLEDEMGIWFTGNSPPTDLFWFAEEHGIDKIAIRVTASVEGDGTIWASASADGPGSLLADTRAEFVGGGKGYQLVERYSGSDPASHIDGNAVGASVLTGSTRLETDDRVRLQSKADDLVSQYHRAVLEGPVTLEGVDLDMSGAVGTTIRGIEGRGLNFNTAPRFKSPRYPTVVGVEFDVQEQETRLRLETLRNV